MADIDLSKYENRLETFSRSTFLPATPLHIKDLVEAGFSFTGRGSLVFCYACGFMYDNWQEGDEPLSIHKNGKPACPYLQQMQSRNTSTTKKETSNKLKFYWDTTNNCLIGTDKMSFRVVGPAPNAQNEPAPVFKRTKSDNQKSINSASSNACSLPQMEKKPDYENLPADIAQYATNREGKKSSVIKSARERLCFMRNNGNRLRTFTSSFPLISKDTLQEFADAGFFYLVEADVIQCFSCMLVATEWQGIVHPIQMHFTQSPTCTFILEAINSREALRETVQQSTQNTSRNKVSMAKDGKRPNSFSADEDSYHPSAPIRCHSSEPLRDQVNTQTLSELVVKPFTHNLKLNDERKGFAGQDSLTPGYNAMRNTVKLSPEFTSGEVVSQTKRYVVQETKPDAHLLMQKSREQQLTHTNMTELGKRIQSFTTWPSETPVVPFDLALAGFYYIGYKDGVKCFECGILLKSWNQGDTAWGEHAKWSPHCPWVTQHLEKQSSGTPFNFTLTPAKRKDPRAQQRPLHSTYEEELPLTGTSLRESVIQLACPMDSDEKWSTNNTLQEAQSSFEIPSEPTIALTRVTDTDEDTSTASLVDGKSITNPAVLQSLLEMGFTTTIIRKVKDLYLSENGAIFAHPDELIEGIMHYQEFGNLQNFARGTVDPSGQATFSAEHSLSCQASPSANSNYTLGAESPYHFQQEIDKAKELHICKICMDNDICVIFLPCQHLMSCENCAVDLKDCPICRKPISKTMKAFLS